MFVNLHRQQHSVLEGLVKHTYAGTDERSKVRHLLDGIKTNKFDVVRNQIITNADYRNNFDMCATFYLDFIGLSDRRGKATQLASPTNTKQKCPGSALNPNQK